MVTYDWYDVILGEENRHSPYLSANSHDFLGITRFQLGQGRRIENWNPNSWLRSSSSETDGEADDFLAEYLNLPTMSAPLRTALDSAAMGVNEVQYLPVRVFMSSGEDVPGFCIANVISRVPALDPGNCFMLEIDEKEIDPDTGRRKVRSIGRIALKREPLKGHDIIRLHEYRPAVLVSERFVKLFNQAGFTGATFSRVRVS